MGDLTAAAGSGPLGTIDYIAPEQVQAAVDGRADQYALACLVVHCLTGTPPFEGDTEAAVLFAQVNAEPPRMSDRRPDLPLAMDELMRRALSRIRRGASATAARSSPRWPPPPVSPWPTGP